MYCFKNYWWKIAFSLHLVGFKIMFWERKCRNNYPKNKIWPR